MRSAAAVRRDASYAAFVVQEASGDVRNDDGTWTMRELRAGERLTLAGVPASIAVDDVFRDPMSAPR